MTSTDIKPLVTLDEIRTAHARIHGYISRTPIMTSDTLDVMAGAKLYFKCENLQKVGAFKARGATNAIFSLTDSEAKLGVVTHSSGNHAAALAWAARLRGIAAHIVMPRNSPNAKVASVRRYGGAIDFCEPTVKSRESMAAQVTERTGATFIHPYDDSRVIAGQGTVVLELLEDVPDLDLILCPVGGGGLLSGAACAAKSLKATIRVIAVEPAEADDAFRSFKARRVIASTQNCTIADGLRTSLSELTLSHLLRYVDDIVTVSEKGIIAAMRQIWEIMKLVVEPSGAVAYAAVNGGKVYARRQRVGIIITGGNLDLDGLPWKNPA